VRPISSTPSLELLNNMLQYRVTQNAVSFQLLQL